MMDVPSLLVLLAWLASLRPDGNATTVSSARHDGNATTVQSPLRSCNRSEEWNSRTAVARWRHDLSEADQRQLAPTVRSSVVTCATVVRRLHGGNATLDATTPNESRSLQNNRTDEWDQLVRWWQDLSEWEQRQLAPPVFVFALLMFCLYACLDVLGRLLVGMIFRYIRATLAARPGLRAVLLLLVLLVPLLAAAALLVPEQQCQDVESCAAVRTLHDGNATTSNASRDLQSNRSDESNSLSLFQLSLVFYGVLLIVRPLIDRWRYWMWQVGTSIFRYFRAALAARPFHRQVLRAFVLACWIRLPVLLTAWLQGWLPGWLSTGLRSALLCRLMAAFGIALDFEWWGRDKTRLTCVLLWLGVSPLGGANLYSLAFLYELVVMKLAFGALSDAIIQTLSDQPVRHRMRAAPRRISSHRTTLHLLRTSAGPRPAMAYLQVQPRPTFLAPSRRRSPGFRRSANRRLAAASRRARGARRPRRRRRPARLRLRADVRHHAPACHHATWHHVRVRCSCGLGGPKFSLPSHRVWRAAASVSAYAQPRAAQHDRGLDRHPVIFELPTCSLSAAPPAARDASNPPPPWRT